MLTFIDICKIVLGERFEKLCKEWAQTKNEDNKYEVEFKDYGSFHANIEKGKLVSDNEGNYYLIEDKQYEIESFFYGIDRDLRNAIRNGILNCYRNIASIIPRYEMTNSESICKDSLARCFYPGAYETVEKFLESFYPGVYFDEKEFYDAFPELGKKNKNDPNGKKNGLRPVGKQKPKAGVVVRKMREQEKTDREIAIHLLNDGYKKIEIAKAIFPVGNERSYYYKLLDKMIK